MGIMDYHIVSYHAWKGKGGKTLHLAAGTTAFFDAEFNIRMTKEQAMIFIHTLEWGMLNEAADEHMVARAAPSRPSVAPPPRGAMFLSEQQMIALEDYRKYKTYMSRN